MHNHKLGGIRSRFCDESRNKKIKSRGLVIEVPQWPDDNNQQQYVDEYADISHYYFNEFGIKKKDKGDCKPKTVKSTYEKFVTKNNKKRKYLFSTETSRVVFDNDIIKRWNNGTLLEENKSKYKVLILSALSKEIKKIKDEQIKNEGIEAKRSKDEEKNTIPNNITEEVCINHFNQYDNVIEEASNSKVNN